MLSFRILRVDVFFFFLGGGGGGGGGGRGVGGLRAVDVLGGTWGCGLM